MYLLHFLFLVIEVPCFSVLLDCPNCSTVCEENKLLTHMRKVHKIKACESNLILGRVKTKIQAMDDLMTKRGFSLYCTPAFVEQYQVSRYNCCVARPIYKIVCI